MERKPIAAEGDIGLRRSLGAAQLVALGIGAIVGAGLFSLTGIAASRLRRPGGGAELRHRGRGLWR